MSLTEPAFLFAVEYQLPLFSIGDQMAEASLPRQLQRLAIETGRELVGVMHPFRLIDALCKQTLSDLLPLYLLIHIRCLLLRVPGLALNMLLLLL